MIRIKTGEVQEMFQRGFGSGRENLDGARYDQKLLLSHGLQ